MPESALSYQPDVFPFPPTPCFANLTEVCKYLNDCGFDVTWQSFHRFYSTYINGHKSTIRQTMEAHGISTDLDEPSQHDKISMLIIRGALEEEIRPELVRVIERRCAGNRDQMVDRMYRYALHGIPEVKTWRSRMIHHLNAVIKAMVESLEAHHGGENNQGYLTRLYRASMKSMIASVQIIRRPEQWFTVLGNQQDINIDVIVPRFSRCYATLYQSFGHLLEDDEPNMEAAREIRDEMKKTLKTFGCSTATEKKIYRTCGSIIADIDRGIIRPEEFEERAYGVVYDELGGIAHRSIRDTMAHVAVIDHLVAEFISELFNINRDDFEKRRLIFAENIARHMSQDSEPQSSEGTACGIMD